MNQQEEIDGLCEQIGSLKRLALAELTENSELSMEVNNLGITISQLLDALGEISKGERAFSMDPLTHASNAIDSMKEIANNAIRWAKEEGRA